MYFFQAPELFLSDKLEKILSNSKRMSKMKLLVDHLSRIKNEETCAISLLLSEQIN